MSSPICKLPWYSMWLSLRRRHPYLPAESVLGRLRMRIVRCMYESIMYVRCRPGPQGSSVRRRHSNITMVHAS